ncbi:M1 family metallopeptidase [Kordia algicida OT-1]|uniref:Aminopeptidase N n=1 Tax=Kordia algicida OT-1 TaxID=391587 RepID=A9E041_9FLAO|nr:M1 family metallopeptidase [Kordia algicida]EDP95796.1 aminopeptidase [Kordia algicida OT-1]
MTQKILSFCFLFVQSFLFAQQTDIVDFKTAKVDVVLRPELKEVGIDVFYEFEVLKDTDSIYLDMRTLNTYKVYQQSFKGTSSYTDKKIILKSNFKKGEKHTVGLATFTNPKKAIYFIDWNKKKGRKQVWTQGQGKYTSNWLPSLDDVNDKIEFDFSITFDKRYEVITNGKLLKKESPNDSLTKWYYDMQQPMSSYLAAIAIGKYKKKEATSKSGIPLEMYYYTEDKAKFEPTYRYTKRIFDFLEAEIGVQYPWQNYKQVPVKDFLYAGMENTGTTIFSDSFVVDSIGFVDKNYVNVNAHELAHQWFGNLVTAKSGKHHWLQEGFATYYALLAEKEIFGDDYFHWKLFKSAQELKVLNDGKGEALLNPKASSLTFYQKGAWALHVLRAKVGEKPFKNAVKRYLDTYRFKSAETDDFITIVEEESHQNLADFVQTWLVNPQLPDDFYDFDKLLTHNSGINENLYSLLGGMQGAPAQVASFRKLKTSKESATTCINISNIFKLSQNESAKKEAPISEELLVNLTKNIPNDSPLISNDVYKAAFATNNLKVRQAVAQTLNNIPIELKTDYESLLDDESYVTKEAALYNLWVNFPADQKKYLDQTKNVQGFNDKSFRILWLTLAIVTKNYSGHDTPKYYQELSNYTRSYNHFEVRQNAFVYINELRAFTDQNLADLVNGAMHHNWRFAKFCRDLLDSIIKNPNYKENIQRTKKLLTAKELSFLEKRMKN